MKRALTSMALFGAIAAGGMTLTAGGASAAVEPGLYRLCPTVVNVPGAYGCRTLMMKQYIDEVRSMRTPGFGYGPVVSTPTGGYMSLQVLGQNGLGRLEFRKTPTGYDVISTAVAGPNAAALRMTKIR